MEVRTTGVPVIGERELRRAADILRRYKQGKQNLERRIIADEDWWKLRQWRQFSDKGNPNDDRPASGWLFNVIMGKHADAALFSKYLDPLRKGESVGVISEAGCPAVADPGADVVAIAQREGLHVVPLVGPSSILLAVMGSGFNGQSFAFHGYLPIEPGERAKKLKTLEQRVYAESQTQLFIETPYRNHKMIEDLVRSCRPHTRLCVAADISCPDESIRTLSLGEWAKTKYDYQKTPAIFLLYK